MSHPETLEQKIDDLLRALGGLERLRELSRLSSLDHLVNLHLLSHLTRLDKIEGLSALTKLEELEKLTELGRLEKLENLQEIKRLVELEKLDKLSSLEKLGELEKLKTLSQLDKLQHLEELTKLNELHRLDALGSLKNLGGLERLDHLKYLENLDRLQELSVLVKLESLDGLKAFLEKSDEKFAKLKHLEALDNLPLLEKLNELHKLDKLDRLDELSKLDELKRLAVLEEAPPSVPVLEHATQPAPPPTSIPTNWRAALVAFAMSFFSGLIGMLLVVFVLLVPQGKRLTQEAVSFLGFGPAHQANWALAILAENESGQFPRYWLQFQERLEDELALAFNPKAPWPLAHRYGLLHALTSYDFDYQGTSLKHKIRSDVVARLDDWEAQWKERLTRDVAHVMQKNDDGQQLALWNQLKELVVGSRWEDLWKIASVRSEDKYARQAAFLALAQIHLRDEGRAQELLENFSSEF